MGRFAALVLLMGCSSNPYEPFYQHEPGGWQYTPLGIKRDAGPLGSVKHGYVTDAEIDAAIDAGYERYRKLYPEYPVPVAQFRVTLNDDYVMYVQGAGWAGGVSYGEHLIGLCIWSRGKSDIDPGDVWEKRRPGDSFGTHYTYWRFTQRPLCIAMAHEVLHLAIDDPEHKSPLWARLSTASKEGGTHGQDYRLQP